MPRRKGVKNIGLQLTDDEFNALDAYAEYIGYDKSAVIRGALRQIVPNFPADTWAQHERWQERRKNKKIKK